MIHHEGHFNSLDGSKLYYQSWKASRDKTPDCKAVIAIVHGSGEHSGRYANVVNHFLEKEFVLYGFDFRGHGKSEGKSGHVINWQQYRNDLDAFLQIISDENPDEKIFLYSHSMGAQIALDYLTQGVHRSLAGVIASAAAIAPPPTSPLLIAVGEILSVVLPGFMLQNGLDVNAISRDPVVVQAYHNDPLVGSRISVRFGSEFLACIDRVQSNAGNIDVPLFMFHGDADRIIPVQGTLRFFEKVGFADKKLKIYAGGYHEPHNDLQKQEVFQDVEQWLSEHSV